LWQLLSELDKRVIVLNLPYTYPAYEVNGILVSGWDAPFKDATFSQPQEVSRDILQRFPDYKDNLWVSELQPLRNNVQFAEFVHKLRTGYEQQAQIAIDLMAREPWDVLMVHFQQTDWIQHKLWAYIEQACKQGDDHRPEIEATRECYRYFDEWLGRLFRGVQPFSPTIILLSDHGFGPLNGTLHPNFYLKQWGYLSTAVKKSSRLGTLKKAIRNSKSETVQRVYQSIVAAKNQFANGATAKHDSWADNASDVMGFRGKNWDWPRTKAVMVYAYQLGFIYVNSVGRGPLGIVEPGSEHESVVVDLLRRFRDIRHPRTGQPLLQSAQRGTDVYSCSNPGVLVPDIVLFPVDGYGFSFSFAEALTEGSEEGTHRHNGVVAIQGATMRTPVSRFLPNLIDMAPTILHLLGLSVPIDMDGRVLEEIMMTNKPISYARVDETGLNTPTPYSSEEENLVAQRLRGLGYLD
jgi:predicted AlkP superfamily phosphohydrolase/phosphomutase